MAGEGTGMTSHEGGSQTDGLRREDWELHLKYIAALHRPLKLTDYPACPYLCPFPLLLILPVLIPPVFFCFFFVTIRSPPSTDTH